MAAPAAAMAIVTGRWLSSQRDERAAVGLREPATDEIEVDPPQAEANAQRDQPGCDRLEVLLGRRESVHHAEDDLAEDDDREQPEALDERVRWA